MSRIEAITIEAAQGDEAQTQSSRGLSDAAQVTEDHTNCGLRILPVSDMNLGLALTLLAVSRKGALSLPTVEPDL
jgi:hypothetical protein